MYAAGADHVLREPCRKIMKAIAAGQVEAVTDAEIFQEILYRYMHIGQREKGFTIFDLFGEVMMDRILPIEHADVRSARSLAEQYPFLSPRDLIHLAVMLRYGLTAITTADTGFDRIDAVKRIDPSEFPDLK
jgi:hypothetical protein